MISKNIIYVSLFILIGIFGSCQKDNIATDKEDVSIKKMVLKLETEINKNPEKLTKELKQRLKKIADNKLVFEGTVLNEKGIGLAGVNITLGNEHIGVTDFDGNFKLKVNEGQKVSFNYVELPQKNITVVKNKKYKIIL